MEIPISETVSLKSLGLDEAWLQAQIWETPSCLGLGDLEGVTKDRVISSGGRLDILLKNPIDDAMYEVETMLGETDPDHIVLVGFRYGSKRDDIQAVLESNGVQYAEQHRRFRFQMTPDKFRDKSEMFVEIAKLNKEWWVG